MWTARIPQERLPTKSCPAVFTLSLTSSSSDGDIRRPRIYSKREGPNAKYRSIAAAGSSGKGTRQSLYNQPIGCASLQYSSGRYALYRPSYC